MKFVLSLLIGVLTLCDAAIAATGDPLDLQIRYGHFYTSILVNADVVRHEPHHPLSLKIHAATA
jgi:hypothetical protein